MPSSVRRLLVAETLLGVQFWFPVWLIFLVDRGFPLGTIVLADGVFRLTAVLFEVPTGALADRLGRRRSHVLIALATTVVFVVIAGIDTTGELFVGWIAWGVLWAMASGTASAHLYELAVREQVHDQRVRLFGTLTSVRTGAALVSQLLAGVAYTWAPTAPFLLTAGLGFVAAMLLITLPADPEELVTQTPAPWRQNMRPGPLRSAVAVAAMVLLFGWSVRILIQPLLLELELAASLSGPVYAIYAGAGVAAGAITRRLRRDHLPRGVLVGWATLLAAGATATVAPGLGPWVAVPLLGFGFHLASTAAEVVVNDHSSDDRRAATLSVAAALGGLAMVVGRPALGLIADATSVPVAFAAWTCAGLVLVVPLVRQLQHLTVPKPDRGARPPDSSPHPTEREIERP